MRIFRFFLFLLVVSSCSHDSSLIVSKDRLRVNLGAEPMTLDPRKARNLNAVGLCRVFFEGLTRISREGKAELALAEKVEISSDGKRYVFTLKKAFWSNGDRITAHDFAYSWKQSLSPQFPAPCAENLYAIRGAKEAKEGKIPLEEIGIQVPQEQVLIVELEHAAPYFLEVLASPISFAVPKKAEELGKKWCSDSSEFICSGPFHLKEWKHQDSLLADKNFNYWDEKNVKLSSIFFVMVSPEVELSLFESGDLDWAGSPFSTLPMDALKNLKEKSLFSTAPYSGTVFLRINTSDRLLGLSSLRKALSASINRAFIEKHLLAGGQIAAISFVPPSLLPFQTMQREQTAKSLFEEALQEISLRKETLFPFRLFYVSSEINHLVAQTLQRQWKETLGLEVELQAVEAKIFYDSLAKGKYQMALSSWIADINDPINFLEVLKYKEGGANHTGWQNETYIHLLDQSDQVAEREGREKLLQQAQQLLLEEMPIIPIYQASICYLKKKGIEGVYVSPLGHIDFKWTEIR
jgi:oligopeptide transport system substrate-binding protein